MPWNPTLRGPESRTEDLDHVKVQRYRVFRQDAAYHALAALVSDVKAISKNP